MDDFTQQTLEQNKGKGPITKQKSSYNIKYKEIWTENICYIMLKAKAGAHPLQKVMQHDVIPAQELIMALQEWGLMLMKIENQLKLIIVMHK